MPSLTEAQREENRQRKILTQRLLALQSWSEHATDDEKKIVEPALKRLGIVKAQMPLHVPQRKELPPPAKK